MLTKTKDQGKYTDFRNLTEPKNNFATETDTILQTQLTRKKDEKKTRQFREPTKPTTKQ